MFKPCEHCGHKNLLIAHYCAQCGGAFAQTGSPRVSRRSRPFKIGAGWFLLLLPVGLFFVANRATWHLPTGRAGIKETRRYELPSTKAKGIFDLLSPRRVRVLVRECGAATCVEGTPREVNVLDRFVELLCRVGCTHPRCIQTHMDQARRTWTTRRSYRLPASQAETLFRLLASEDVPVGVSQRNSEVRVTASEEDQGTIARVVELLRGRRNP